MVFDLPVLILGAAAAGQSADRAKTTDNESVEIIVTADREGSFSADLVQVGSFRDTRQIDVPLTLTVIPEAVLDAQQASSIGDAARNTAGVTGLLVGPSVYSNLAIRGIPVDPRGNYRLNGSLSVLNFIDLPLENKSRIEVLKGISALYYGFSTPSGVVNLVTKRPPEALSLEAAIRGNGHGQLQAVLEGGDTFGDLGVRGTLAFGSVDNGIERTSGRRDFQAIALQYEPTASLQLNLDVERIVKRVTEPTIWVGPGARARLITQVPRLPSPSTNAGSEGFMNVARETNVLARLRWLATRRWSLVVEAGISDATRDRRFSTLGLFDPATGNGVLSASVAKDQRFRNRSIRADLSGAFHTGPLKHELLIGASNNFRTQYQTAPITVAGVATAEGRAGCVALGLQSDCIQNGYDPAPLANLRFDQSASYDPSRDTRISDTGLYVFDRISLATGNVDWLSVQLGARKSFYREQVAVRRDHFRETFSANPTLFSAGAIAKPRPWISLYASVIEGLESVPPAPNSVANDGEILPPGESRQHEAGVKVEPIPGLLLTAARFNVRRQLIYVNTDNRFVNDGRARYRGWELSASGEVTPNLSIMASAMLLDARQRLAGDPAIDGKRPENSARRQWSLFAEYRLPSVLRGLALSAGAFHIGPRAINPENSLFVPGYTLFDAGASYDFRIGKRQVTLRAYAQNITGKRYFASTASNVLAYGLPPSFKVAISASN